MAAKVPFLSVVQMGLGGRADELDAATRNGVRNSQNDSEN
jgi:hypothetical protein